MRWIAPFVLAVLVWAPSAAHAQVKEKFKPPEIKKIQVGFQTFQDDERTAYKVGLWTPIYVTLHGGTDGIKTIDNVVPYLEVKTPDSEDVETIIRIPVDVDPAKDAGDVRTFDGYIKTGHMGRNLSEIKVTLKTKDRDYSPRSFEPSWTVDVDRHLYLTLGAKMPLLNRAVKRVHQQVNEEKDLDRDMGFRQIVFETRAEMLPKVWFGYNSIDLAILTTENRRFLTALSGDAERVKALAQWVRRGGRLIVPIAPANQDVIATILSSTAWEPGIPVVPPGAGAKGQENRVQHLTGLGNWAGAFDAFTAKDGIPIATLDPGNVPAGDWRVLAATSDEPGAKPLMAQVRYGLGQITYVAISLDDAHFHAWPGKEKFLQSLITQLAPRSPADFNAMEQFNMGRRAPNDVSTDLVGSLDDFDVTVIPFGLVAVFIVLYILVVGPLDFFLLKYVFKRLEWTWITFPSVVLGVSIIAYFAAYTLKGRDLKINKIDIVDFDLRTSLDRQTRQPTKVRAYGQSFFTILSPRIQNYTVGLEPNPEFWGAEIKKVKGKRGEVDEVLSVDLLSWMGRPSGGMHDMGRGGSAGFFRKPYAFREDASGLEGVPIPVWTTKAFSASWEQKLDKSPFVFDLTYHLKEVRGQDFKITGKIENHLGVDLVDVWLVYDNRFFPIEGGLQSMKTGGQAKTLALSDRSKVEIERWPHIEAKEAEPDGREWAKNPPGELIKRLLFTELYDRKDITRNHLLRPLDLSWRVQEERRDNDRRTREAILFGRVRYRNGKADEIMRDAKDPVPTKLWLGEFPNQDRSLPAVPGMMNQDTVIRAILPVRPGDE